MKKLITFILTCMICGTIGAQKVFTVAFATSSDDFVSVRERPTKKSRELAKLWAFNHGLGEGVLLKKGKWCKVKVGKVTGWAYGKYVGTMNWVEGTGSTLLVANAAQTNIYRENNEDGSRPLWFATVKKGTIIADKFTVEGDYYVLTTAHDNLYIKKQEARIVSK